jgi:hypothetical protein
LNEEAEKERGAAHAGRAALYAETSMDELTTLRTLAACTTVLAAAMVAANVNARVTVAGFVIFITASLAWMADGWFESKTSLLIQNAILLLINVLGVWRWLPRAEKEAGMSGPGATPAPSFLGTFRDKDHAPRAEKR